MTALPPVDPVQEIITEARTWASSAKISFLDYARVTVLASELEAAIRERDAARVANATLVREVYRLSRGLRVNAELRDLRRQPPESDYERGRRAGSIETYTLMRRVLDNLADDVAVTTLEANITT